MAKLSKIKAPLAPTSIEGVFMRGVSMSKLREGLEVEQGDDSEDKLEGLRWMFEHVFVDADGEPFEDAQTVEDIEALDIAVIHALAEDVASFLAPTKALKGR